MENGYHDAKNCTATPCYTPDNVTALYAPRLLLEHYSRGVRRTFVHQLIYRAPNPARDDHDDHFGLLHTDYTRKPQFMAIKNLLSLGSRAIPAPRPSTPAPSATRSPALPAACGRFYCRAATAATCSSSGAASRFMTRVTASRCPSSDRVGRSALGLHRCPVPSRDPLATNGATGKTQTSVTLSAGS